MSVGGGRRAAEQAIERAAEDVRERACFAV